MIPDRGRKHEREHGRETGPACTVGLRYADEVQPRPVLSREGARGLRIRSILPAGLDSVKAPPAPLIPGGRPANGYPPSIFDTAARFGSKAEAPEVARLVLFMYSRIIGRISQRSTSLHPRRLRALIESMIEADYWTEERPAIRYRGKDGKPDGRAAILAITPAFLEYIAHLETADGRRYAGPGRAAARIPVQPPACSPIGEGIPEEIASILARGTGLKARFPALVEMLLSPDLFHGLPGTEELSTAEIWRKALKAWRRLAAHPPCSELMPDWGYDDRGWITSRRPCLYTLPQVARLAGLESMSGDDLAEVDFSGCQLNIALIRRGEPARPDPHTWLMNRMHDRGWTTLTRQGTKDHDNPILHGRHMGHYLHLLRDGKVTDPPELFRDMKNIIGRTVGRELARTQGEIMTRAIELLGGWTDRVGLPVFDSILTPEPDLAAEAMATASREILHGEALITKVKQPTQLSMDALQFKVAP